MTSQDGFSAKAGSSRTSLVALGRSGQKSHSKTACGIPAGTMIENLNALSKVGRAFDRRCVELSQGSWAKLRQDGHDPEQLNKFELYISVGTVDNMCKQTQTDIALSIQARSLQLLQ